MTEARDWLVQWFVNRGRMQSRMSEDFLDLNYFDAGLLNSIEVIELISEIEDRYDIRFSERDFQDPRFTTISGLSDMIAGLCAQQS